MIDIILHPAVVVPWAILLFIPWNLYLRVGLALFIFCALIVILFAGHHDDGLGIVILYALLIMAILIWALAGVAQFVMRRGITGAWPTFKRHPADRIFVWAGYALLALCVFLFAASKAAGSEHVILIHLILFGIAIASIREPGFAISLALLTCFSLYHPTIVTNAAKHAASGSPHCIYLNQRKSFATGWRALTFLTMDKGEWSPHAYLVLEDEPRVKAHWSFRRQSFEPVRYNYPELTCPTD